MGLEDTLKDQVEDKAKDVMDDPDKNSKIEQLAKDKGISIDKAREQFLGQEKNS